MTHSRDVREDFNSGNNVDKFYYSYSTRHFDGADARCVSDNKICSVVTAEPAESTAVRV